jgi:hypothetical protein
VIVVLKLVLTPLLVGGSALVARRWGPTIGGWIIALPLTSGPVLAFLALDHGSDFAASAAVGSLAGLAAIAVFSVAYDRAARRLGPVPCLVVGAVAFVATGSVLEPALGAPVALVAVVVVAAIASAARLIPASGLAHPPVEYPRWDLPARMVVATALVLGITSFAPFLGPRWSGLAATYPVYISVLAAFTHRHAGRVAAADVLAGLLSGLYGTVAFYLVVIVAVVALGPLVAFAGAVAAALAIEGVTLRRTLRAGLEPEPA